MLSLLLSILLNIFHPPVTYDISLAGNFGEPRPHHFHCGIDIKTNGVEGKPIYAIGDGYVSRVTRGKYGFGNAVYITHPDGYISIYCHLRSFTPRIKAALRRWQYAHKTSEADATFSPLECPVSQGMLIALSGNTGNSYGPHLHLEIHDLKTGNMLDPLAFIGNQIIDTVPPIIHSLKAYPQENEGIFCGSATEQIFSVSPAKSLTAWGKVGFGLWASDYMQGSNNHLGIRETILQVDGNEVFHALVDDLPTASNRLVNSWGDYSYWYRHKIWYLKSFIEPGNSLSVLKANENRGIVDFNEERDYQIEYILRDYNGNERREHFTVRGEKSVIQRLTSGLKAEENGNMPLRRFRWNQTNTCSLPGMQLVVPYGLLATDVYIHPFIQQRPDAISDSYSFYPTSYPLITDGEISIYARQENIGLDSILHQEPDVSKFYVSANGKFCGGKYVEGWVTGAIRELGATYRLEYDTDPPKVKPVSLGERIVLSVIDEKSGLDSFSASIDGRFVVFDAKEKTSLYICDLKETPIRKTGSPHKLIFAVTDKRANTYTYETSIMY